MNTPAQETTASDLPSQIMALLLTADDVRLLTTSLEKLKEELFKTGTASPIEKINEYIPHMYASIITASLTKESDDPTPVEVGKVIEVLKSSFVTMKTVSVTVAIDPPQNTITRLSEWIKKQFGNDTLMEITIDRSILGGAIVIHDGTYIDLSLRKKLTTLFEEKRSRIEKQLTMGRSPA